MYKYFSSCFIANTQIFLLILWSKQPDHILKSGHTEFCTRNYHMHSVHCTHCISQPWFDLCVLIHNCVTFVLLLFVSIVRLDVRCVVRLQKLKTEVIDAGANSAQTNAAVAAHVCMF